jgi:collagenase-like PrtC family protease
VCRYKFKVYLEEEKRPGRLFQLVEDEQGSYLLSSKDLCTIERLKEILPVVDGLKIEGRSKSEFYVAATTRAYRHTRDSILAGKEPDENIKNLVYQIPHRYYWEGFLFNDIRYTPEMEITDGKGHIKEEFASLPADDVRKKLYPVDEVLEKKSSSDLINMAKEDEVNCCGDW